MGFPLLLYTHSTPKIGHKFKKNFRVLRFGFACAAFHLRGNGIKRWGSAAPEIKAAALISAVFDGAYRQSPLGFACTGSRLPPPEETANAERSRKQTDRLRLLLFFLCPSAGKNQPKTVTRLSACICYSFTAQPFCSSGTHNQNHQRRFWLFLQARHA